MKLPLFCLLNLVLIPSSASATFIDDFTNGPSGYWNNEIGNWSAPGGVYGAGSPGNLPNASSALAFSITDGSIDADVIGTTDGGFWCRSTLRPGTPVGRSGVLLVLKAGNAYWHHVADGNSYGSIIGFAGGLYPSGGTIHAQVTVTGNVYSLYVNGALTPATTYSTGAFPQGQFGLYDLNVTGFDTVLIAGESANTCSGSVSLGETTQSATGKVVTWEVRRGNTSIVDTDNVTLGSGGTFTFPCYQLIGSYQVTMKASHWLKQAVTGLSFLGGVSGLQFALINGDVDGDNEIGPGDFGALSAAFGSMDGDPNWNSEADLDEDTEVGPSDFGILSSNFGLTGD